MKVTMALLRALGYVCILLVLYYSLKDQGYRCPLDEFSEQLMDADISHSHVIHKRQAESNSSSYTVQVVVQMADIEQFRSSLRALNLPIALNSTTVTNITTTTVCSRENMTEYQCRCEESFAWSFNSCNTTGACDAITANTCGCINGLPADDQYCQLNTSQTETTPTSSPTTSPPTTTTTPQVLVYNLAFDIRVPVSSVPPNFIVSFRNFVGSIPIPRMVTSSIRLTALNFTTACAPVSGSQQCRCENQFRWPCDICNRYACMNESSQSCTCITVLPSDGRYCEPTSSFNTTCTRETTTPVMTTTTLMTTTTPITTTTPKRTTAGGPTQPPQEKLIRVVMDIPFQETYNNPESQIYKDTRDSILNNCETLSIKCKVTDLSFRSGSTIADSTVSASSLPDSTFETIRTGVIDELGKLYPLITDSAEPLNFSRTDVFFGESVSVSCGPPPESLNFSANWVAEWRVDDVLIRADDNHRFTKPADKAILTVRKFFRTDNGVYECKLTDPPVTKAVFRQKSNGPFTFKEIPVITVKPETQRLECVEDLPSVTLTCSVQSPYKVQFRVTSGPAPDESITHTVSFASCGKKQFTCEEATFTRFTKDINLEFISGDFDCNDGRFGVGNVGDVAIAPCDPNKEGEKIGVCTDNNGLKEWQEEDNCILIPILQLLNQSQDLNNNTLPLFLGELKTVAVNFTNDVIDSPATINAIVTILINVANVSSVNSIVINPTSMTDIMITTGVLITDDARNSWDSLNAKTRRTVVSNSTVTGTNITEVDEPSASSRLLFSLESVTESLLNETFNIVTPLILLNKTTFTDDFDYTDFNSSVQIEIPDSGLQNHVITVLIFESMDNVLPPRDEANSSFNFINGRVVLVQSNDVDNVTFTFNVLNDTLGNPQCVFWNFSLFNGLGGWDDEGCELVLSINDTVTCNCNHLTSFSILMSSHIPEELKIILDYITYIGVGISLASLIICLIIEGIIWRKIRRKRISYLRHVTIVNIALSLLIADIWFIIGAAISDLQQNNPPACTAATFFIHLFYLALFFWMLASGLLLFHGTVNVFGSGLSKNAMLGIGFSLGYGAPLLIAVITIAVTAPTDEYIRGDDACWLNWFESKALLAFVIPALMIVVINLIILCVVIYKMVRRRVTTDAAQAEERHVLVVIARSLAFLTPLFGLTWGLGVGTMTSPENFGIHVAFAFFNSLQGFFILVFGTLLDKNVRSEIAVKSQTSSNGTRSTSAGMSSSSGLDFLRNLRRGRDGYNISSTSGADSYNT